MSTRASYVSEKEELSIRKQCDLLSINRSKVYYKQVAESPRKEEIKHLIEERFIQEPAHGVLRIQDHLRDSGINANVKLVRKLLRKMGIMAIYPKRNLSKLGEAKYIFPYLLRGMDITSPNQVWEIDITYIKMKHGYVYLTAIIDVYSRFIVGWDISNSLAAENSLNVMKKAVVQYGKPCIVNSDQGSQFTCKKWVEFLTEQDIKISMDGKGRALDNVYIERFWRRIKYDYIHLNPSENAAELYSGVAQFFNNYNNRDRHQGINREIPVKRYLNAA